MKYLFTLLITGFAISLNAQADLSTPENTIRTLFKGMYEGDSTLVRASFAKDATLNSVFTTKKGEEKVESGSVGDFATAVGTPHEEIWDEQVSNLTINEDGNLAQAWMNYTFVHGGKFSHCGVNAMHLIKTNGEWKIFQLMDTRRKGNCE